jgi:hypothetical protein
LFNKVNLGSGGQHNARILALCYLVQGLSYGNLGLVFDKNFIVTENTKDVSKVTTSPYETVRDSAIKALWKAIKICDTATFTLPGSIFNNVDISNTTLKQIANSFIARYIVLTSRSVSNNSEISSGTDKTGKPSYNWDSVLYHASNGITSDFGSKFSGWPYNGGTWYDLNFYYLNLPDWARINCRIINLMDPSYPPRYPSNGVAPSVHAGLPSGKASSIDHRFTTDFQFLSSVNFKPERGYEFYSNYRYSRFDIYYARTGDVMYEFRKYENDLYKAEAYANLGQLDKANAILGYNPLPIINNSNYPRISRGYLFQPVNATKQDILYAIFYERDIELLGQGFMLAFADMRRRDMLQSGTPLHFPITGKELQTLQLPNYTFGGFPDGINTSSGGWFDSNGNLVSSIY